jgi:hypothetical protein
MSAVPMGFRAHYALIEERPFALVDGLRVSNLGSLESFGFRNSVRPMHLFGHNLDHDYYFKLPP